MSNKGSYKSRMTGYIQEIINPESYLSWVNKNTTLQGIPFNCDRYPFQEAIMNDMAREMHVIKPSQIGLPICLKTLVFSKKGWMQLGEVQVGDKVYTPKGKLTTVLYLSLIQTDSPCYEITFCDGTKITADENHRWYVHSDKAFNLTGLYGKTGRIPKDLDYARQGRITTKAIFENYKGKGARPNNNIFYIPCAEPIQTKGFDLGVDPYCLGLWLGNGTRQTGVITVCKDYLSETISTLEAKGVRVSEYNDPNREDEGWTQLTLYVGEDTFYSKLKKILDPLAEKHFLPEWLLLSIEQRFELLQGLIDSDGSISKLGRVEFYNTSKNLVDGFFTLAASLGFKPRIRERAQVGKVSVLKNGYEIKSKKDIYACHFMAYNDVVLSKLTFKQSKLKPKEGNRSTESFQRRIVNVQPVASVPVRCIMVDDAEHQFVCSHAFITTSNTEVQLRKALAFVTRNPYRNLIYTMPDKDMRKRVYQNRVLPILTNDPIFHELNAQGKNPIRSIETTEIGTSQLLMFPANEKAATSQPADVIFNDEVDLSDPAIIALFNSRLQGSDLKINHNYSTPTYDGMGISALYETSDQREYLFKCPHCNYYQMPEFSTKFIRVPKLPAEAEDDLANFDPIWLEKYNINFSDAYSVCEKCGKKVTYGDRENHQWVAKNPHRQIRGYRVSPFSTRSLDATYILESLIKYIALDNMKGFKNTVLGLTHESSDERLPEGLLRTLFMNHKRDIDYEDINRDAPYFIGIDMGAICNIVISKAFSTTQVETVLFETVKKELLLERIKFLDSKYRFTGGHIDRLPLITDSEKVRDWSEKKIMPIQYEQHKGAPIVSKEDEYGVLSYLAVNRTYHLDCFANAVRVGYIRFGGYGTQKETVIQHLRAMVRVVIEDKNGAERVPIWKKIDKKDHYFHACAYNYQAVLQYYQGYAYDTGYGGTKSALILGSIDNNILVPNNPFNFLGGR